MKTYTPHKPPFKPQQSVFKTMTTEQLKQLVARSHRAQFNGVDFQAIAIALADRYGIKHEEEEFSALMSAPDPGCDCGFCERAPWE